MAACAFLTGALPVPGQAQAGPPAYRTVRHDEDYAFLADPGRCTDGLDPIKHISLGKPGYYLSLGGELRQRFELFENANWQPAPADGFLLQKYMLHADLHLGSRFRVFANLKSGLQDGRMGGPRPTDEDRLDLHEAFVDVVLDHGHAVAVRLGRREMALGSQRLVSVRAGPNVRQAFDGISLLAAPGEWKLEAFATRPAKTLVGVFDDGTDRARAFWGAYAVGPLRLFEDANVDLYYLGLDRELARYEQGTAPERRHTVGTRIWRRKPPWDYNVELVYQWGSFGDGPIRAWTVATDTGLTLRSSSWRPRFGLKADVTSGDRDPDEPRLESFNPLFPRGAYFGENQLIGPVNHIDLHPSIDLHPHPSVTISPSWAFFWRQSAQDGVYGVPGNLIRPVNGATARYVGSQPAVMATVTLGRHVSLAADWEYFIAGPFLRQSGSAHDVTYLASWVSFVF